MILNAFGPDQAHQVLPYRISTNRVLTHRVQGCRCIPVDLSTSALGSNLDYPLSAFSFYILA